MAWFSASTSANLALLFPVPAPAKGPAYQLKEYRTMARITVEDCLDNIDNIFEMVLVAAKRARRIAHGAEPMVELENDKPTVIALREIAEGVDVAEGHVTPAILDEVEAPPADELLQPEVADEILPVRGISIGD